MSLTEDPTARRSAITPALRTRRKLIEVALPLDAINAASVREKAIRHGHPSTLHLWWARRPLAAARAVIFSQMVDDPGEYTDELLADPATRERAVRELRQRREGWAERLANQEAAKAVGDVTEADPGPEPTLEECAADLERQRLFRLIEQLVTWENNTNERLLDQARAEIRRSWRRTCADNQDHARAAELFDPDRLPAFHDPFAGGGALPLEAQRLGLDAHASDLNPVAVLINKAMIEIPPRFAGRPPVNPEARAKTGHSGSWKGAAGLAEDVRYYGKWMRDEAKRRIGYLYPPIEVTAAMAKDRADLLPYVGRKLKVIAWLWARTVPSPDPATGGAPVPLMSSFWLAKRPGHRAWVEPIVDRASNSWTFRVRSGTPPDASIVDAGTKAGRGDFRCLLTGAPIPAQATREHGRAGRIGYRMVAIVAEGERGRVYLPSTPAAEDAAASEHRGDILGTLLPTQALGFRVQNYGYLTHSSLFTDRQRTALDALSGLVAEVRERVSPDAVAAGLEGGPSLSDGGRGARAYADAVAVMLGMAVSRRHDRWTAFSIWNTVGEKLESIIRLSAIQMTWEFAEGNPFSESTGNFLDGVALTAEAVEPLGVGSPGEAHQADARVLDREQRHAVSTDPPYFDNIPYADLSDLFYVWLRRSLRPLLPDLTSTVLVPKADELVADPSRHGSKGAAERYFFDGMRDVISALRSHAHPALPVTIFYAFKQSETAQEGVVSTGWDRFLSAVVDGGFAVVGTWPVRTEQTGGLRNVDRNSLATSVVLVCRPREVEAGDATRREFLTELKRELPIAVAHLQRGNIAPVDLAQAAIGPGMAVFTRHHRVVDAQGHDVKVRDALAMINQALDEVLAEQEGDFDSDTRFALAWFDQYGFTVGEYGVAEGLARAKVTSVAGMVEAGILESGHSKVRLLPPWELDPAWDPAKDPRRPAWQSVHQLILAANRGEEALAQLVGKLGTEADTARELAYRLYVLCDRKKRATEAGWYNGLVQSWPEAVRLSSKGPIATAVQGQLFGEG